MATRGSNDLNMLLKAQVVKIRAELDVKGSMPKIREQVREISRKLEKHPVKLQVRLDYKIGELKKQMNMLQTSLNTAKTLKPIKIQVDIDVKGSASKIKKQLGEINKIVNEFNQNYSKQIKQVEQTAKRSQQALGRATNVPTDGAVQNFNNIKRYTNQLAEAERILRSKVPKGAGLFASTQLKDAQGNLHGFIASLEQANGVVEKIRFDWDSQANKFVPINRQTVDTMQKHVHKARQQLQLLEGDINKLQDGTSKTMLRGAYESLQNRAELSQDAVKHLQTEIKKEQSLQQMADRTNKAYIERQKLIRDIRIARDKEIQKDPTVDVRPYQQMIKNVREGTKSVQEQRLELTKLNDANKKRERTEKEIIENTKKRMQLMRQLRKIERETVTTDKTSQGLLREIKYMTQRANKAKDWIAIQKRMNDLTNSNDNARELRQSIDLQDKLARKLREVGAIHGHTNEEIEKSVRRMRQTALNSYADLERMYHRTDRQLKNLRADNRRFISEGTTLIGGQTTNVRERNQLSQIRTAIDTNDIVTLQKYIGQLKGGRVETVALEQTTDAMGRAVDRMKVKMAGAGKTVKTYMIDLDRATNSLRQMRSGIDYNANRNLGVMEQLRIAMARVPTWMTAMTAFYGSIRGVQAMTREILEVDKALTELKRVADAGINIDTIFRGAVTMAGELGNNVHDVMQTMNDFARTFGDFNERQLLAITNTATLMSNVSELGAQEAGETLISTMNAFNIEAEESIRIVDAFNEVDNNFAVSTKQLAEGMSRGASTAKTFGVEMEETVGHITAISSVTMESGRIIGNSLKTIYSRITTMPSVQEALEGINVALYDQSGNVREVQDILTDLAGTWHEISDVERQNIAVKVAGRYQLSRFLALMNNWGTAVDATQTALTSQGSALRENSAYMESFEARINSLKNGFTEMSLAVGDAFLSGALLAGIELLKSLAEMAINVAENFGALPAVMGILGVILTGMGVFKGSIGGVIAFLKLMGTEFKTATVGMGVFRGGLAGTTASLRAFSVLAPTVVAGLKAIGTAIKGLVASTVIGAVFVGIGMAIEHLVGKYNEQKQAQEDLKKVNDTLVDSYRNTSGAYQEIQDGQTKTVSGLEALVAKHEELQDAVNRGDIQEGTEAYNEYLQVNQELADKMPNMVEYVDSKGRAHLRESEALRENAKYARELSEEYARLTLVDFEENTKGRIDSIKDLNDSIKDLNKEIRKMEDLNGKEWGGGDRGGIGYGIPKPSGTYDYDSEIQQAKIQAIIAQQEIQHEIQQINGLINETVLASLEANGMLQYMSDSAVSATEKIIVNNEKMLRDIAMNTELSDKEREEQLTAKINELFAVGEEVGMLIATKSQELIEGVTDPEELHEIKNTFDTILNTLPDQFFSLESLDNVDVFKNNLDGVLDVTNKIKDGQGGLDGLISDFEKLGFTQEEAEKMAIQLGFAFDNQALKAEALAKEELGELNDALDTYIEKSIEAIDASEALFGYSDDDMNALKSHLEMLTAMKQLGQENNQVWHDSVTAIADYYGVTNQYVEDNMNKFLELSQLMSEWSPTFDEEGNLEKDAKKKFDRILKLAEDLDIELTIDEDGEIDKNTEDIKENTDAKKDNKKASEDNSSAIDVLNEKFGNFKDNTNETNRAVWLDTVKEQLKELDSNIIITKDETGGLKLQMADGSESEWLKTLQSQLDEVGGVLDVVKDEKTGALKLVLNDGTGSEFLNTVKTDAEETGTAIEDNITKFETFQERTSLPQKYSQINFKELFTGLDDTATKVDVLAQALEDVWDNVNYLSNIEIIVGYLREQFELLEDAIKSVFDGNKGDFTDLTEKAKNAKDAVEDVRDAIAKMNNKAREIPLDSFDGFIDSSKIAGKSIEDFKSSFDGIAGKVTILSGASMLYTGALQSVNNATLNSIMLIQTYANGLMILSNHLANIALLSQGVTITQHALADAMSRVTSVIQSYDVAIANAGRGVTNAFVEMATSIVVYTAIIISTYEQHEDAVIDLTRVTENSWNTIVSTLARKGTLAVDAIRKIADLMHDTFKRRMDDIVRVAEQLPARIGTGITNHMASATSSMTRVAQDMVRRFKQELGIHSPSRVFEELGGDVIAGLANGLTGSDLKSLGQEVFNDFGGGALSSLDDIKTFLEFGALGLNPNFGGQFSMTSPFGMRKNPVTGEYKLHAGTDYGAPMGTPIPATVGGKVVRSGWAGGYGNMVEILGADGLSYIYAHNSRNAVKVGQTVNKGQIIGLVGSTGNSTGPHLHYEVRKNGRPINARGKFANGGFIEQHMIAEMGEEGAEAIIPLVPQRRDRGIQLWEETGLRLGIDPMLMEILAPKSKRSGGFGSFLSGSFGALSGEGGSADGGGGSGTSGTVQPSIYEGGVDFNGDFEFTALNRESLYRYSRRERQADAYNHAISMQESKMNELTENTLKYRNALKKVITESKKLLSVEKADLKATQNRQKAIEKQIKSLGQTSKHTEKQRKKYNELQREYEQNISKIHSLERSIESTNQKIKSTTLEIFTDWVDQIVGRYETAIAGFEAKIDDIDFKLDVLSLTDPDNVKQELKLLADRANQLQRQEATTKNMTKDLQKEYDKAVKKYGKSSKQAKKVKEELDASKEALEDITLAVLRAEKDIMDTRGEVADRGIGQLQDYYKNMKDMALEAINFEKRELEKAHKSKMEMYDEEIEKINSVYDKKLKAMDEEKKQAEYQEQLDEKNAKKAELMNKISLLSRDNSIEGRKRVAELREELATINEEISKMMRDRQDELLREAMEKQKEEQIARIEAQKEAETEEYESRVEELDNEANEITNHYDGMLNDEKRWADMRNNFIKGSFSTLTQELEQMSKQLARMSQGNFDNLTNGFKGFTDELKEEFAQLFGLDVDNMSFNSEGLLDQVADAQKSKYGVYIGNGIDYANPSQTTWSGSSSAKVYEAKAPTAPKSTSTSKSSSKGKAIKIGGRAKVSAKNANAYLDSYGTRALPWSAQAKSAGVGYGDSLYVVHQRNGYVALAKRNNVNDAIAWVQEKDLVGLKSGGYTGNQEGVAMLHKKEQVFNEKDTKNLLDASKLVRAMGDKLPNIGRNSVLDKLATAGQIVNISYGDINVTVEDGNRKKAKDIATEIITGIKKKGL